MKHLQESEIIIICSLQEPEGRHVSILVQRSSGWSCCCCWHLILCLFFSNISGRVLLAVVPVRAGGALRPAYGCCWYSVWMKCNVLKQFWIYIFNRNGRLMHQKCAKWRHGRRLSDGWGVLPYVNPLSWWLQTQWQQTEEQKTVCISISWEGALWFDALGSVC